MKYTGIKIAGREFTLVFNMNANLEMSELIEDYKVTSVGDYIKGQGKEMLIVLAALARQGEILNGRTLDVGLEWFGAHIPYRLSSLVKVQVALLDAVSIGMRMETEEDNDGIEVDVVLEELKKKETPGG